MTSVVVDIGNTRIKWGRCDSDRVVESQSLSHDETDWQTQVAHWNLEPTTDWTIASVDPKSSEKLLRWLEPRFASVKLIESYQDLPIRVEVDFPARVGLDRLLNAIGIQSITTDFEAAVIVDAGTAITIDCIQSPATFQGGYILPGFRLQSLSLHQHTAKLPLVESFSDAKTEVGKNTNSAIRNGILQLILGGIQRIEWQMSSSMTSLLRILTGGDAPLIRSHLSSAWKFAPWLTLEGIRIARSQSK